jgi:polyphosphate glucokinase
MDDDSGRISGGWDRYVLGIDIGGSGVKGAPVDVSTGELVAPRLRIPTPRPSKPNAVAEVVAEICQHFTWQGPVGCTFPAIVQRGIVYSAANVDKSWIGTDGKSLFEAATGCPIVLLNDADAAGIAEMTFGAGRGNRGVVMIITLGTGVGSAIFTEGKLLPNAELGHLIIRDKDAEDRSSDRARQERGYTWQQWAKRVTEHLAYIEALLSPDLFIIGGGVVKERDKFFQYLKTRAPLVPATFRNEAGIAGAALAAAAGHAPD